MGARPMQRLIQDTIRRALADELLFGRLVGGGRVTVDLDDSEQVVLTYGETDPVPRGAGAGDADAGTAGALDRGDGESAESAEPVTA